MKIKKFNEAQETNQLDNGEFNQDSFQPKVKHLLEYLSKLDPEMEVHLDKDGWQYGPECKNEVDVVANSGVFYHLKYKSATEDRYKPGVLFINN